MTKRLLITLLLVVALPASAVAYWSTKGAGSGTAGAATLDAGSKPVATASSRTVTVTWTHTQFKGAALTTYTNGSYTVRRYATDGTFTAICTGVRVATCTDSGVPYGSYTYRVVPKLGGFTGAESPSSDATKVVTDAPTLAAITQTNPGTGVTTGTLGLSWNSVTGATSYTLYRGTSTGGPYTAIATQAGTTYTDATVVAKTTYFYVVRATVVGLDSAASAEQSAAPVFRPAAPASVTATATAGAKVTVNWPAVPDATGYNVYRRLDTATTFPATPLNGSTPVTASTYADTTTTDATAYRYIVRAVRPGVAFSTLESPDSPVSAKVTADGVAPAKPTAVATTATPVVTTAQCGFTVNTRFVNDAGDSAVPLTATLPSPVETGETVRFTVGTVTQTVNATSTTATANLDLSSLADGTLTVSAVAIDAAGNVSAATANTNPIVKDTVSALSGVTYKNNTLFADAISGTAECNAAILITNANNTALTYTSTAATTGAFSVNVAALNLGRAYKYSVQATDIAGNVSPVTTLSGTATGI